MARVLRVLSKLTKFEFYRKLVALPWAMFRYWKALGAWQCHDWLRMIALLEPLVRRNLHATGDHMLLGIAYSRLGQFEKALKHFEQIPLEKVFKIEQPYYSNNYAHVLGKMGCRGMGKDLFGKISRETWPESQRNWAEQYLKDPEGMDLPSLEGMFPQVSLHKRGRGESFDFG